MPDNVSISITEEVQEIEINIQQGVMGPQGLTGATGATGPTGPQGPPGDDAVCLVTSVDTLTGDVDLSSIYQPLNSIFAFKNIAVAAQGTVIADSTADTLTLVAGAGISITTNTGTDTITFTNIGTLSNNRFSFNDSGVAAVSIYDNTNNEWDNVIEYDNNIFYINGTLMLENNLDVGGDIHCTQIHISDESGFGMQHLEIVSAENLSADRAINIILNDASRTLTIAGDATISGTNSGDQNIFSTIAVAGQSNVVADSTSDTLTLVAGSNITITTNASTDTITIAAGGGLSDGDKGDITVSNTGTSWSIDNDVVTFAKMQNITTDRILGRDTAGSGDIEELSVTGGLEFTGSSGIQVSLFTGDVTKTAGGTTLTLATVNSDVGTYGSSTEVPTITVNAKGLITAVSTSSIDFPAYTMFSTIAVPTQSNVVADSSSDTLTFTAGSNIAITTTPSTDTVTFEVTGIGSTIQGYDSTLAALATYNTNGLLTQTAADTFTGRTITGTANQITISNGDGVSGNPTISIPYNLYLGASATAPSSIRFFEDTDNGSNYGDLIAPSSIGSNLTWTLPGSTGTIALTSDITTDAPTNATYVTLSNNTTLSDERVLTAGANISVTDGGAGSTVTIAVTGIGTTIQGFDSTLAALAAYNTNGLLTQTAADTFTGRSIAGTSNEITVTNGDGVSGNPTISLPSVIDLGSKTSLEIPNSAAPTLNTDGQIALDTTVTDFANGLLKYYSTGEMSVVAIPTSLLATPTDGYAVTYDGTNDRFKLSAISSGGDSVKINNNGTVDPDFNDTNPAAPSDAINIKWQFDVTAPTPVSAYVPYGASLTVSSGNLARAALTGDVTASANSNATTIANDAVTFAKFQNISTDKLIGRDAAGSGDAAEIGVTTGIEFDASNNIRQTALSRRRSMTFVFQNAAANEVAYTDDLNISGTIVGWSIRLLDSNDDPVSGSVTLDFWSNNRADPTNANSNITSGTKPSVTTATRNYATSVDWADTSLAIGDCCAAEIESLTTATQVIFTVYFEVQG